MATGDGGRVQGLHTPRLSAAVSAAGTHLRRGLKWWLDELISLVPESVKRALEHDEKKLIIDIVSGQAAVWLCEAGTQHKIVTLHMEFAGEQKEEIDSKVHGLSAYVDDTILRVPADHALTKQLVLPLATAENLDEVIAFEMDRETPFKRTQVYYDYRVVNKDQSTQKICIELTAVPRKLMDPVLARLAEWGLAPSIVEIGGESVEAQSRFVGSGLNLLPPSRRMKAGKHRLSRWLALLLAILVTTAVVLPLIQKRETMLELQSKVAEAKIAATEAQRVEKRIKRLAEQAQFFSNKRGEKPIVVELLSELTSILPDDTWLSMFEVSHNRLRIQGESGSASSLIAFIDDSKLLDNPAFSSPVTRNARTGRDRFALEAHIGTNGAAK